MPEVNQNAALLALIAELYARLDAAQRHAQRLEAKLVEVTGEPPGGDSATP